VSKTLWKWEQNGNGGENGTATYFPGTVYEISVQLPTFIEANHLYGCIAATIRDERLAARGELLAQIGRLKP